MNSSPRPTDPARTPDIPERELSGLSRPRFVLAASLIAYLALAAALSVSQIGYFNADFIGYSTIVHRLLKDPPTSITGYWSPLYAWCMAPLIYAGMDDLAAGRVVLVAGGAVYLLAVFGVVRRFRSADELRNRVITVAVMTVAVVQSATWATRMLDPDLLADSLLFCYFYAVLDPKLPRSPRRALAAGALAGMAYLGKAFMLPFTLLHLPATLWMGWWVSRGSGQDSARGLRCRANTTLAFLVGLAVVAGPWIAILSSHYGKATFSTAGAANHANMGPTAFGKDPLWKPELAADFIADPHYGPDWSAWQDGEHFLQQLKVIAYNLNNCIGYVVAWAVFGGIFVLAARGSRHRPSAEAISRGPSPGSWWCVMTILIYCGGYSLINLESRYIVPVITPLLCLAAMLAATGTAHLAEDRLQGIRHRWRQSAWWVVPLILLVSAPDVYRLADIGLNHPQSDTLARYRPIAEHLRLARLDSKSFAANRWHAGLNVSYAAGNVPNYLGTPLPDSATSMMEQLRGSNAAVYLRWHGLNAPAAPPSAIDAFAPAAPWRLSATIPDAASNSSVVEVYTLGPVLR